ncbi:MAG: hypothetical protein NTW11_00830 [Candidatus Staskawiczbacteria bacterium]|nr:hypothetical protein [Candidatus Staskawiczbacteria bacterium]
MQKIEKEKAQSPFVLAIIDLIDVYHYADVFDQERYAWIGWQKYAKYAECDTLIKLADRLFWAFNPSAKTQEDWIKWDSGYDVRVYDANMACVYAAHEKLPEK